VTSLSYQCYMWCEVKRAFRTWPSHRLSLFEWYSACCDSEYCKKYHHAFQWVDIVTLWKTADFSGHSTVHSKLVETYSGFFVGRLTFRCMATPWIRGRYHPDGPFLAGLPARSNRRPTVIMVDGIVKHYVAIQKDLADDSVWKWSIRHVVSSCLTVTVACCR